MNIGYKYSNTGSHLALHYLLMERERDRERARERERERERERGLKQQVRDKASRPENTHASS